MTLFLYGGIALVSLIAFLLVVLRLRSGRSRLIAVAIYALGLVTVVTVAVASRKPSDPVRDYGREIDRAVADLGQRYVLFQSLGPPDSTLFDGNSCERGSVRVDHRFLQRTWRIAQPVDFPTLEAALERDGFETSPVSDSGAAAYGFLANRDDLAIQVQSLDTDTEVHFFSGPCVPRPTIELANARHDARDERTILASRLGIQRRALRANSRPASAHCAFAGRRGCSTQLLDTAAGFLVAEFIPKRSHGPHPLSSFGTACEGPSLRRSCSTRLLDAAAGITEGGYFVREPL